MRLTKLRARGEGIATPVSGASAVVDSERGDSMPLNALTVCWKAASALPCHVNSLAVAFAIAAS